MNKNLFRTCIGLALGGSLLITSTVMGMTSGPTGYEALKIAVKNSDSVKNATFSMTGTLIDNNEELMKLSSTLKVEQEQLVSGSVFIDTNELDRNYIFSVNDKTMVFKHDASEIYNKITCTQKENESEMKHYEFENPQMDAICESILDALVGDLKNQVTLKNIGDDRKQISINLDKNEIPTLFNLVLNLNAAKNEEFNVECETNNKVAKIFGLKPKVFEFPKLVSSIQTEEVNIEIIIDKDSIIKEMDLEFEVSGNDAQNNVHNQKLQIGFEVSEINSTNADIIDLAGKEVKELSTKELGCN